jgi:hypothetical protein
MNESTKPSKQFLIRGAIATGIVAIILIVQTDWFRKLLNKEPLPPTVPPQTVGDIVGADSNQNGIADWEERLWGLDPTVLYTDGVPNKQIIEDKKKALGIPTAGTSATEPQNETDELARQLLTITSALGQSSDVSDEELRTIAMKIADSVEFENDSAHYSLKDLNTVQTTTASLNAYYQTMGTVSGRYDAGAVDLDILVTALETGNLSDLARLKETKALYQQYARALLAVPTPIGIENHHLAMINSVYGISLAVGYLAELSENGANAVAGVALYKIYDQKLTNALKNIEEYLTRYGILRAQ